MAVTEEEDLNNALTYICILDDVAKDVDRRRVLRRSQRACNVCACDGAVLLDSLVGAEVFDLGRAGLAVVSPKIPEKDEKFHERLCVNITRRVRRLRDGGSPVDLWCRGCGATTEDGALSGVAFTRRCTDRLVQDPRAAGRQWLGGCVGCRCLSDEPRSVT